MTVSSLVQTSAGRFTVSFDSGEEIKSTLNIVTDFRIFSGKDMDEQELSEFKQQSSRALTRERALEVLSRRPMISCRELSDKLKRSGLEESACQDCIRWLCERGFLNDAVYAEAVVRHYASKGYGKGRITAEFAKRGIPRDYWDEALEALPEADDKLDSFISSHLKDSSDPEQIRKISNTLFRRGYSWEQIKSALNRFNADTEDY